MRWRPLFILYSERGAALLGVLVVVILMGLASGLAGMSWTAIVQKSKEAELFWRGDQYRRAIESYVAETQGISGSEGTMLPNSAATAYPDSLEDLLRDTRFQHTVRHIRRLYNDPMTGEDWDLIKDPAGRIKGVRSASGLEPFKKEGFEDPYTSFRLAGSYRNWEFVYEPKRRITRSTDQSRSPQGLPTRSVQDLSR